MKPAVYSVPCINCVHITYVYTDLCMKQGDIMCMHLYGYKVHIWTMLQYIKCLVFSQCISFSSAAVVKAVKILYDQEMKVSNGLLVVLLIVATLASEANAWRWWRETFRRRYPITATGRIKCYIDGQYKPMPHTLVRLMDKELIGNQFIATSRTDAAGCFEVSGTARELIGKPDPRIRVDYEYTGPYGTIRVQNWFRLLRRYRSVVKSYASNVHFGDINISDEHCRALMRFLDAIKDFNTRAQYPFPISILHVSTNAILASWANTAYATIDRIRIGRGVSITPQTAKHELAHIFRHNYDGNIRHFNADAIGFRYFQSHYCSKRTNSGFAFNEGWAEFWEGDCYGEYYLIIVIFCVPYLKRASYICTSRLQVLSHVQGICTFPAHYGIYVYYIGN